VRGEETRIMGTPVGEITDEFKTSNLLGLLK
jgi:hypothetical protein